MKEIHLWGVKQNNLKNIEVKIPVGSFTVICGPSGSGKSSLAFETLFAEGQRRFIESMSNYARQFLNKAPKPDIEGINNIPPAIAIEQKNTVKNSRSTVGTTTEVIDYLRLLYEKIGQPHCPTHGVLAEKESVTEATAKAIKSFSGQRGYVLVEIKAADRILQGKKLHSLLLQDGFLRIYKPAGQGEFVEISEPAALKKSLPKESFFLVIDRLAFSEEERGRLADSLTQAYEASVKYNTRLTVRKAVILTTEGQRLKVSEQASCPICEYTPPTISSKLFSFNSPIGACPTCKGFGNLLILDKAKVIPDPTKSLDLGALHPFSMPSAAHERKQLLAFCRKQKIDVKKPWVDLPKNHQDLIWNGGKDFFGVVGLFEYLEQIKYKMHVRVFISRFRSPSVCPTCKGHRLRPEVQFITIAGKSINDLSSLTIEDLEKFFAKLKLSDFQMSVAGEIFKQLKTRLNFLMRVGVNYLSMSRETRTLSGGEYQRLALANQLGMGLSQALYVLDEPTVGLHPRDNDRLISILKDIKNLGNTLVIVEHDQDVIQSSENIIEMGPGSGSLGGQVVYSGPTSGLYSCPTSVTAPYLKPKKKSTPRPVRPVELDNYKYKIEITGASGHNLKNLDVIFPLNRLVVVTGVSGSGKSTLVTKTLYPTLARALELEYLPSREFKKIEGVENIKNVLLIDQSPIGKSARSSPMTYLKAFDAVRNILAATPEAKSRGYTPGTFSLNVDGGRCPSCRGTGVEEIDMQFMDNVVIPCDVCDGKKYRNEILEIQLHGKNISQILAMTVKEAMDFFVAHPNVRKPLSILKEVGLDYLQIGQPANSLSGGESQRLKIAKEFAQIQQKNTLYILDEPTTGLHFREVDLLMKVLHKLIETGGSVIVVEHNLDVILNSDYVIDLGPEAGIHGGKLVISGTPNEIMKCKESLTGKYLQAYVDRQ
ncbi:MAG: excinuclease ABC subunit UvrA [Bdellovibrionaceae bacterium]|nr:excinuclease ABC subunit UvrA [Pseudobdellovibrionaceae bacterium]